MPANIPIMNTLCIFLGLTTFSMAYENLALKKLAYQRYQYRGLEGTLTDARNAVDGLKSNLSVWAGQCAISDVGKHEAFWLVDLSSTYSIHHITIYYRTENVLWEPSNASESLPSRFLGFSLYVPNTTDKSEGKLCVKSENFTLNTMPAILTTNCFVRGRFVIYYNERRTGVTYPDEYSTYAYNELCEVEVFGCRTSGYYGKNCSIPCPDPHCRYCNLETGTCQECKPGYPGHHCKLECQDGKYGDGCQMDCGRCRDLKQCHHVNGTCLSGCEQGYIGEKCIFCENGKYGQGCTSVCGHCFNNSGCHHANGSCVTGCEPGFGGDVCKSHNLAYNKPTYQQFQYKGMSHNLTDASNAVDGLKSNLDVWGGQCVASENNRQTATWWVNLTRIYAIHHIKIYYRTGNIDWGIFNGFTSRFLGFSLYVSDTTHKDGGTLCFKDTNFTLSTIPAVLNITCLVFGQYVIYYNERLEGVTYPDDYSSNAFNDLCELEVFGCAEAGFYGINCSIPCPEPNCRYCHPETGTCQEYQQGFEGDNCKKNEIGTSIENIVAFTIFSILLTIAVAVIIFLKFRRPNYPKDEKKENDQKQEQHVYENGPRHFSDFTVVDENQQYVELNTKTNTSLYQNVS
ncbi:uncharacterized protein LOC144624230 [Crassostrea virginica]